MQASLILCIYPDPQQWARRWGERKKGLPAPAVLELLFCKPMPPSESVGVKHIE